MDKSGKSVFVQRDEKTAKAKAAEMIRQLQGRFARAMEIFDAGIDDVLRNLHYPIERLSPEIRCRTRVVDIFPHCGACLRLIGMLQVEVHEDWLTSDKADLQFDDTPAGESAAKVVFMAAGGHKLNCVNGKRKDDTKETRWLLTSDSLTSCWPTTRSQKT